MFVYENVQGGCAEKRMLPGEVHLFCVMNCRDQVQVLVTRKLIVWRCVAKVNV